MPGNFQGGILEMAVVIDMSMSKEQAEERAKELVSTLKTHSEVFRNVRLNTILWKGDEDFVKEVTPLAMLQMGRFFEDFESVPINKKWDGLLATLKKFYARSKLIIVLTEAGTIQMNDSEGADASALITVDNKTEAKENMQPFLHKKMMVVCYGPEIKIKSGTEIFMSLIR